MAYTLNMIKDVVDKYNVVSYLNFDADHPVAISGIRLYCGPEDLSPDILYVGYLSEIMECKNRTPVFLCLRNRVPDASEAPEAMKNLMVVNTNIGVQALFNEVLDHFIKVLQWQDAMHTSLIEGGDIQQLMDLSEPILKNHIAVMDPALKLIAHTKNIDPKCETTRKLIQYGYHPEENLERFNKYRRFEAWTNCDDLVFTQNPDLSIHTTILKSFKINGCLAMLVTMVCCNCPPTQGLVDLYNILLENIYACMKPSYLSNNLADWKYGQLIGDLINGPDMSPDYVQLRAQSVGLKFDEDYLLAKFTFADPDNIPLIHLAMDLTNSMPFASITIFEKNIIVLYPQSGDPKYIPEQATIDDFSSKIAWIMKEYDVICGISNICHTLMQVRDCNRQADTAMLLGRQLANNKTANSFLSCHQGKIDRIFYYHDYYLYDLAKTWHSLPGTAGPSREALQQIYANDMINHTDNIRVLYWYLVFERKATETGEYLHMHRNSVLYRIERLEEQYDLNLDNYQTRIALAMELAWLALNDSATSEKE